MIRSLLLAGAAILALSGSASAADHPCERATWLHDFGALGGWDLPVGTVCGHGEVDNNTGTGVGPHTYDQVPRKEPEPPPCDHPGGDYPHGGNT